MASMLKNRTISILRLVKIAANSIGVAGIETKSMATSLLQALGISVLFRAQDISENALMFCGNPMNSGA